MNHLNHSHSSSSRPNSNCNRLGLPGVQHGTSMHPQLMCSLVPPLPLKPVSPMPPLPRSPQLKLLLIFSLYWLGLAAFCPPSAIAIPIQNSNLQTAIDAA